MRRRSSRPGAEEDDRATRTAGRQAHRQSSVAELGRAHPQEFPGRVAGDGGELACQVGLVGITAFDSGDLGDRLAALQPRAGVLEARKPGRLFGTDAVLGGEHPVSLRADHPDISTSVATVMRPRVRWMSVATRARHRGRHRRPSRATPGR